MKELFYSANYQKIIDSYETLKKYKKSDLSFLIGSYIFTGQFEKAENIVKINSKRSKDLNSEIEFYFLIHFVRMSESSEAIKKIRVLREISIKRKNPLNLFYFYQGFALLRYYQGYFDSSLYFSKKSYQQSLNINNKYPMMISTDLMAHNHAQTGNYSEAMNVFQESLKLAKGFNNSNNIEIIKLSKINYDIEYGININKNLKKINQLILNSNSEDYLTKTNLHLIKAQVLLHSGQIDQAKNLLNMTAVNVYKKQNKRQSTILNLKLAHIDHLFGENEKSLNLLRMSLNFLTSNFDLLLKIKVMGLLKNILTNLGTISDKKFNEDLNYLTKKSGYFVSKSIGQEKIYIQDRIQYFKSRLTFFEKDKDNIINQLKEESLLGLLYYTKKYNHLNFIDFNFNKRKILYSVNGDLNFCQSIGPKSYEFLLFLCSAKSISKKEMIENFWGLKYDSFIHDNLIYSTLRRLKNYMPEIQKLIYMNETYLTLNPNCNVTSRNKEIHTSHHVNHVNTKITLSIRQRILLEKCKIGTVITPANYIKTFKVSRMTATRDLRELKTKNFLHSTGKGRGTSYTVIKTI